MSFQDEFGAPANASRDADTSANQAVFGNEGGASGGVDIMAAILRYKWAVILPTMVGIGLGILAHSQIPERYQSSVRLLVESDSPIVLDTTSGNVFSGVPGADLIQSQLFSDKVMEAAYNHRDMEPFREMIDNEYGSMQGVASRTVLFEPETDEKESKTSLAFRLAVEHTNPEFCEAAVLALNESLVEYFQEKRSGSTQELKKLITEAKDNLGPTIIKLEEEYREFQSKVKLQWDQKGLAFNPYRDQQLRLTARLAELEEEQRAAETELKIIEVTVSEAKDPIIAIEIIGQLLNKKLVLPNERRRAAGIKEEDVNLAWLEVEKQLVPLLVEREQQASQVGANHPSVKQLDTQILITRDKLKELSKQQTERMALLLDSTEKEVKEAEEAKVAVISAQQARNTMLLTQIDVLKKQIEAERIKAEALSQSEQENLARSQEIERVHLLRAQLDEQLAKVNLTDKQAGVELTQLSRPSQAFIVGPNLALLLAGGTGIGLLIGCGLAYLLEGQAATFRSAEEISASLKLPIFSHVPFDPTRRKRAKAGEEDPYAELDDKLSVLHRPSSVAAEAVRACRTAVFFEAGRTDARVLQVTSPLPSDGKSTIAGNLAVSIAQTGKRVLMIDCDLRRPQLSDNFALSESKGLTSILNGDCDPDSAIYESPVKNLFVMPSGPIPLNPAEALTLTEMSELIEWVRDRYDYVIVDSPPLLVVTDPSIVAGLVDGVILTIKVRRKSKSNVKEAVSILRGVGANILGIVINASDDSSGSDGYKGYGHYKYRRHAAKYNADYTYDNSTRDKRYASNKSSQPRLLVGGRTSTNGSTYPSQANSDGKLADADRSTAVAELDDLN